MSLNFAIVICAPLCQQQTTNHAYRYPLISHTMHRVLLLAGLTACSLASDIANKAVLATQRNDDLVQAVKNGQFNAMVSLLAEGTDKNFQEDSTGSSLLSLAAQENQLQIVKHLLEIGASVHTRDSNGGTALFGPATNGFTECTELLIRGGIDVNALDSKRKSPKKKSCFSFSR